VTSPLFTPLKIGPIEVPNRIAISPMCMYSADDGTASDFHIQHLCRFSMSGAGLAVMEATGVNAVGRISPGCLGLYSDENEKALARAVAIAKKYAMPGFRLGIQLSHAGRKGSTPYPWDRGAALTPEKGAWETVAPSAIPFGNDVPAPRELTDAEIRQIIADFAASAKRAVSAGLDLIEIHAAHGYLIHQFHSPLTNKRTDDWGGTLEKRLRFPLAVAEAVRAATPSHIALGARINSTDFNDDGLGVEDAVLLAGELKKRGLDYVCVSSGNIVPGGRPALGPGFNVERAARVKKETGIVTRTVGFIAGPKFAEEVIASGAVDQVALARAFLDDSNWGWHAAEALGHPMAPPPQYGRVKAGTWPAAKESRAVG
jgi:2,4-dienoyl-CoA reductase-like NADH-dependent reductase (Old Yellow Enzyme family)